MKIERPCSLFLLIILLLTLPVQAQTLTSDKAFRGAVAWLRTTSAFVNGNLAYQPDDTITKIWDTEHTRVLAYVMNLNPTGYIVVTPDKRLNPVIAYSENTHFSLKESHDNILLNFIRVDITNRLAALEDGVIDADKIAEQSAAWDHALRLVSPDGHILHKTFVPMEDVEYGPYMTSTWSQGNDGGGQNTYNYYTPSNYVCGCVATAMGQVMNYYEWPVTGTGTSSYTWDNGSDPSQVLSVDHGATTYDWANIIDNYSDGAKSLSERQAVGQLVYQSGVAVNMNFTSTGSSAFISVSHYALRDHFRLAADHAFNTGNFYETLYNNILAGRLAILGISRVGGGHAIVADGVRHNTGDHDGYSRYYHLNMGWGGTADAWYDLPNINTTANGGSYDYTSVDEAIWNIVPLPEMNDPGSTTTGSTISLSWDVSSNLNASAYQVDQAYVNGTTGTFTDGAESGTANWEITDNWEQTSQRQYSGSYSFRGWVRPSMTDKGYFLLDKAVYIDASTSITYDYGVNYHKNSIVNFQISTDGVTWSDLKTYDLYDEDGGTTWYSESGINLTSYIGSYVFLRFEMNKPYSNFYDGDTYNFAGFFVDNLTISNCKTGDWTTLTTSETNENYTVNASSNGEYLFRTRAYKYGSWWDWSNVESVSKSSALVQTKVFLEGPYNDGSGEMNTTINGSLPTTSPYTDSRVVNPIPSADIVDWVFVELRTTSDGSAVASRSALLHKDGRIVADDGTTGTIDLDAAAGDYFIVIKHQNHLAVMSDEVHTLSSESSTLYDFTVDETTAYDKYFGGEAADLETGIYGMISGDVNQNGEITTEDYTAWYNDARIGASGYYTSDMDMDEEVTTSDYTKWYNNARVGASSNVPNL